MATKYEKIEIPLCLENPDTKLFLKILDKESKQVWNAASKLVTSVWRATSSYCSLEDVLLHVSSTIDNKVGTNIKKRFLDDTCVEVICKNFLKSKAKKELARDPYRKFKDLGWIPFTRRSIKFKDNKSFDGSFKLWGLNFKVPSSAAIPERILFTNGQLLEKEPGVWVVQFVIPENNLKHCGEDYLSVSDYIKSPKKIKTPSILISEGAA